MASFGTKSSNKLSTCHTDLQSILNQAIMFVDFSVVEGHRPCEKQFEYYKRGRKKVGEKWVVTKHREIITNIDGYAKKGKHNSFPSLATDIVPYEKGRQDWKNIDRFKRIMYFTKGIAAGMNIKLRFGGDWDGDFYENDQSFHDIPHVELHSKLIDGKWVKY